MVGGGVVLGNATLCLSSQSEVDVRNVRVLRR
jgi:hypothetical protein